MSEGFVIAIRVSEVRSTFIMDEPKGGEIKLRWTTDPRAAKVFKTKKSAQACYDRHTESLEKRKAKIHDAPKPPAKPKVEESEESEG